MFGESREIDQAYPTKERLMSGEILVFENGKVYDQSNYDSAQSSSYFMERKAFVFLDKGESISLCVKRRKAGTPGVMYNVQPYGYFEIKITNDNGKAKTETIKEIKGDECTNLNNKSFPINMGIDKKTSINPWIIVSSILGLGLIGLVIYLIANKKRRR